jgi:type II secretory pathway pseudopilin PulG
MRSNTHSVIRTKRGFTFVEVLAAMVFLGLVIPVVVSALTISNRAGVAAERESIAAQLAQNRMSELTIGNEWTSASSRGDFGVDWPGYRWELTKSDWQSGAMTELTVAVIYTVQGSEREVRISTLVNQSLTTQ